MLTDRERSATKDVCVVPKTPDSKMVLLVRRTWPERERILCSLCQNESLFFFYACVIPFSHYGYLGVFCKFNSFLFIHLLIFLILILNFLIYLFVPNKFLENSNIFHHYLRSAFLGEKRLIKNIFFLSIVIFLDNKYIKTLQNSNKIHSKNFKPNSGIKLEIIG